MRAPRIYFSSLAVIGAALSQMGSTGGGCGDGPIIRDPGFDLWCGDQLCAWKVERGSAMRVATWHEGDSGVELIGPDAAIEQLSPVTSGDGRCIKFDLVSNVEDNAEVYFNVDVQSDGTLEMHERLPTSHWAPLTYNIFVPVSYNGVRFEITKRGAGTAVLANIGARLDSGGCAGLTPLDPGPRKNGSLCVLGSECGSGLCLHEEPPLAVPGELGGGIFAVGVCAGCDRHAATSTCGAGEVCGVGDPALPVAAPPLQCRPAASHELGEMCVVDAECASGICARTAQPVGACSACTTSTSCTGSAQCAPSWPTGPWVCGGGAHLAQHGAACGTDDDCASASCAGAVRKQCNDRRACSTAADCPFGSTVSGTGLQNGPCMTVGVQGGSCD